MQDARPPDLARTVFQLLALGALILTSFWIVRPFLIAAAWAAMIVVATWPVLQRLRALLGSQRAAVAVMTIALLLVLVVPLYFGISAIVDNARYLAEAPRLLASLDFPQLPAWIETLPVVGSRIAALWQQILSASPEEIATRVAPYVRDLALWFVGQVGGIGLLLVQFLLTVVIAAFLYAHGEAAAEKASSFATRLAGQRGEKALHLAVGAVRGVALGVVVTAIVQSSLVGLGLAVVGVPFASVLTFVVFVLAVAQVGAIPVLLPSVIWVYWTRSVAWGTVFLVWAVFCTTFDNVLRPLLIKQGTNLALSLIFVGVIGGLIAFGVIGLFVGPVVLTVAYSLFQEWIKPENGMPAGTTEVLAAGEAKDGTSDTKEDL